MADSDFDLLCKNCRSYIEGYEDCPDCGAACSIVTMEKCPKERFSSLGCFCGNSAPCTNMQFKTCPNGCFALPAGRCGRCGHQLVYRKKSGGRSGGCYVATAVYGSYDCAEVFALRKFRDDKLMKSWFGRQFVKAYYAVSPAMVRQFGELEWFCKLWRPILDKIIKRLEQHSSST